MHNSWLIMFLVHLTNEHTHICEPHLIQFLVSYIFLLKIDKF